MKYRDCMIAWTPAGNAQFMSPGQVAVGPHPDLTGWSDGWRMTTGGCYSRIKTAPHEMQVAMLFIDFHTIVVRDGVDPQAAHKAFLAIDEYRQMISPDIEGAA